MILVLLYLVFVIAVVGAVYVFLIKPSAEANDPKKTKAEEKQAEKEAKATRKGRMQLNRRKRQNLEGEDDLEANDVPNDDAQDEEQDVKKKGKKRLAKEERKREQKEYEEAQRTAKEEKAAKRGNRMAERDAAREEAERAEQEELERLRAIKEKEEEQEYEKWKDMISVQDTGDVEAELQTESQGLLGEFIDYIKEHKVVVLEDLAAQFGLKAKEAITRVQALEQMGRITGVMDDRGKFIYITEEELQAVAKYIQKEGRVSISELAAASNNLVQLNSKKALTADA